MSDDFFAAPPFEADAAMVSLKRQLRDLKLGERGNAFEVRGKRVVEVAVDELDLQRVAHGHQDQPRPQPAQEHGSFRPR